MRKLACNRLLGTKQLTRGFDYRLDLKRTLRVPTLSLCICNLRPRVVKSFDQVM